MPSARRRVEISGTAAAAWSLLTVTRTNSLPASASSLTCATVASTFAVSVLVMDCTTTGLLPPTLTPPTSTATDFLLSPTAHAPQSFENERILGESTEREGAHQGDRSNVGHPLAPRSSPARRRIDVGPDRAARWNPSRGRGNVSIARPPTMQEASALSDAKITVRDNGPLRIDGGAPLYDPRGEPDRDAARRTALFPLSVWTVEPKAVLRRQPQELRIRRKAGRLEKGVTWPVEAAAALRGHGLHSLHRGAPRRL